MESLPQIHIKVNADPHKNEHPYQGISDHLLSHQICILIPITSLRKCILYCLFYLGCLLFNPLCFILESFLITLLSDCLQIQKLNTPANLSFNPQGTDVKICDTVRVKSLVFCKFEETDFLKRFFCFSID